MRILVCVKQIIQIADPEALPDEGAWDPADGRADYDINYYDTFAIEEAVQIKERLPGVTIDAISVGPDRVETTLRKALALGADNAFHIRTPDLPLMPAAAVADLIHQATAATPYDLILAGVMSEDAMQRLVGPMVAALRHMPCATSVVGVHLDMDKKTVQAVCELEGGVRETVELTLPCLFTIQSGINLPRYASLSNRLRAKSQSIDAVEVQPWEIPDAGLAVGPVFVPPKTPGGEMLNGTAEEKARKLIERLHAKSIL